MSAPLTPEIAAWIDEAVPDGTDTPCGHYNAAANTTCRAVPTRQYMGGRRCWHHTPDKTAKKETS